MLYDDEKRRYGLPLAFRTFSHRFKFIRDGWRYNLSSAMVNIQIHIGASFLFHIYFILSKCIPCWKWYDWSEKSVTPVVSQPSKCVLVCQLSVLSYIYIMWFIRHIGSYIPSHLFQTIHLANMDWNTCRQYDGLPLRWRLSCNSYYSISNITRVMWILPVSFKQRYSGILWQGVHIGCFAELVSIAYWN